jgi:hypothetical protein
MWDPKIFGISLLTILVVVGSYYIGRKTTLLQGTFAPLTN